MEPILTPCGYRCDMCLAFRPNVEANPESRQLLSDGWHRYFGFRIPPEGIICDGCLAENPRLIDSECPVRPCAMSRAMQSCAGCPDYACARLIERLVTYEEIAAHFGELIPPEDRVRFIAPYENKERLEALRASAGLSGSVPRQADCS